jgi:hypothetical protein
MRARIALGLLGLLATTAHADPIDTLTDAESKVYDAWVNVDLTDRKEAFVKAPATGYGIYEERGSNVFKPGESLYTYIEPVGYGWKDLPGDMYEIHFVGDVQLKDASGAVLLDRKGFTETSLKSHNAMMETYINYTLDLSGAPEGKYSLEYTVHDKSSDQELVVDQDFVIKK